MFGSTATIFGQPYRYAQLLGELLAVLLPHKELAIEAKAVLGKKSLSAKLKKVFVFFDVHRKFTWVTSNFPTDV